MPLLTETMCAAGGAFDVGDQPGQVIRIYDENQVPIDTGSVEVLLMAPSGATPSATITHTGVGVYEALLPVLDEGGWWSWRTVASGLINQADQGRFYVRRWAF